MISTETKLKTSNPATEEVLREYVMVTEEEINESVRKARGAYLEWKKDDHKRADLLLAFAESLGKIRKIWPKLLRRKWGRRLKNRGLR